MAQAVEEVSLSNQERLLDLHLEIHCNQKHFTEEKFLIYLSQTVANATDSPYLLEIKISLL